MLRGPITRRYFVSCLGGAAAAWPLAGRAQQRERMRRIGVLLTYAADDPAVRRAMASFVVVLLVLALGHRRSVTASWFTSDKTCGERHATLWFVERLGIDCDRLLRERLWKLYGEGQFGRLRGGRGGAIEYMKQLWHPDE
jgi:hypothetical protein